jgi:hypothetical protein
MSQNIAMKLKFRKGNPIGALDWLAQLVTHIPNKGE